MGDTLTESEFGDKEVAYDPSGRPRKRWLWALAFLILVGFFLPNLIGWFGYHNDIIKAVVNQPNLEVRSESASFGWFSSPKLGRLTVKDSTGHLDVQVAHIQCEKSIVKLWRTTPDIGSLTVARPTINITLPLELELRESEKPPAPLLFSASIRDGDFFLRTEKDAEPVITLGGLNTTIGIEKEDGNRFLTVEPMTLFDHEPIKPELFEKGFELAIPLLADMAKVDGVISANLDALKWPLDDGDLATAEVSGSITLHRLSADIESNLLTKVVELVSKLLDKEVPTGFTVASDTLVQFVITDGQVYHSGLSFLLPQVAEGLQISSEGSVGLDKTVDIRIGFKIPESALKDKPLLQRLASEPVIIRVVGSLEDPEIKLDAEQNLLERLESMFSIDKAPSKEEESAAKRVLRIVGEAVQDKDVQNGAIETTGKVVDWIKERRKKRAEREAAQKASKEDAGDKEEEEKPKRRGLLKRLRGR